MVEILFPSVQNFLLVTFVLEFQRHHVQGFDVTRRQSHISSDHQLAEKSKLSITFFPKPIEHTLRSQGKNGAKNDGYNGQPCFERDAEPCVHLDGSWGIHTGNLSQHNAMSKNRVTEFLVLLPHSFDGARRMNFRRIRWNVRRKAAKLRDEAVPMSALLSGSSQMLRHVTRLVGSIPISNGCAVKHGGAKAVRCGPALEPQRCFCGINGLQSAWKNPFRTNGFLNLWPPVTAASRTPLWLPSGWECRGRRPSTARENPCR